MIKYRLTSTLKSLLVVAISAGLIGGATALPAQANQSDVGMTVSDESPALSAIDTSILTPENINTTIKDLRKADIPAVENPDGSTTFTLPEGLELTLSTSEIKNVKGKKIANPALGGGTESGGVYITLNATDQEALLNGSSVLVTAALCAIPAVGWISCGVIGAAVAIAWTYLNAHGICSNKRTLRIGADWNGNIRYSRCQ